MTILTLTAADGSLQGTQTDGDVDIKFNLESLAVGTYVTFSFKATNVQQAENLDLFVIIGGQSIKLLDVTGNGDYSVQIDASKLQVGVNTLRLLSGNNLNGFGLDNVQADVVVPANQAPNAIDDGSSPTIAVNEDSTVNINVLGNDTDANGDALTITHVGGQPIAVNGSVNVANGAVTLNADKTLTFAPAPNFNGPASFTYSVSDGRGGSDTATVRVGVTAVNDAPVATGGDATGDEDTTITGQVGGTDVENSALTYRLVAPVAGLTLDADGNYSYVPAANFNGTVTFDYVANDGELDSAPQTVTVTVAAVNDAPVATSDVATGGENQTVTIDVLANDTDVEGDELTLVSVGSAAKGNASVSNGKVVFDPGTAFDSLRDGQEESVELSYVVRDSAGAEATSTVTLTVTGANDGPTATADTGTATEDGGAVTLNNLLANDIDLDAGDSKTIVSVATTATTVGTVQLGANGAVVYNPGGGFQSLMVGVTATDSFTYTMRDSFGATSTAIVSMTVLGRTAARRQ